MNNSFLSFALSMTLGLPLVATVTTRRAADQRAAGNTIVQDFRGGRGPQSPWRIIGPDADQVIRLESGGLHVSLPADRPPDRSDVVGVRADLNLEGDFEITGRFELLSTATPPGGAGIGIALHVASDPRFTRFAKVGRFLRPGPENVFVSESWNKIQSDKPKDWKSRAVPTHARTGRLRIARERAILRYLAAEGDDDEFAEIDRQEFGTDAVGIVRFIVTNHGQPIPLDARLIDVTIHSPSMAAADRGSHRPGQALTVLIGVLLLLAVLGVYWLARRRSGATPQGKGDAQRAT
jgi:hypothetical protein